jgi:hypothetical protein
MNCLEVETELGDYADGALDAAATATVATHLASCAACRALVADLQTLRRLTRSLDPQLPPPSLYPRIAAAVHADSRRWSLDRLFGFTDLGWRPLVSAAVMVVVLAGGVWLSWHNVALTTDSSRRVARTDAPAVSPLQPVGTELEAAEQHYTNAIATLEQITKVEGTTLDTPTAAVMQENLAVIDRAIGESREALQKEPSSELAQDSLFEALRSKLSLLQDTIALINEMRKGNQEGAARIVSGMNQP